MTGTTDERGPDSTPVPFTRLDFADPELLEELLALVRGVAERGAFTLGEPVEGFETDFATYCQTEHAVGVSSGTEALALALRALEIGPGDEVIVPSNSFIATAEAVSAVGATPRLVDVDPDTHLLTAEIAARNLSAAVRCIIPVHLFGATVDMDPILELAREAGAYVVEDACQAHGAYYRGRRVGSLGEAGCFSFYPTKNLGAWGDAGAVVTSDPKLAERVRLLRAHGEKPRYHHRLIGGTARIDALQAAVLRKKLTRLDGWNEERRRLGGRLRAALAGAGAADAPRAVQPTSLPFEGADHVYHLFVVRTEQRDELREHLTEHGVASAVHYPQPIHLTDAYAPFGLTEGSLPECEQLSRRICSLPAFPGMGDGELERVAEAVIAFAQKPGPSCVDGEDGRFPDKLERVSAGHPAAAIGDHTPPPARGRENGRG
jgi:dTDP-3-amino-3,4,6-trideoxy-alpha-D-glucose transaminase